MRIESTGCQIGGLDRTRLPAAKWRLRLLRRRWLIPKRWEARANASAQSDFMTTSMPELREQILGVLMQIIDIERRVPV